jgi:hypothetical protein
VGLRRHGGKHRARTRVALRVGLADLKWADIRLGIGCLGAAAILLIGVVVGTALTHQGSTTSGVFFNTLPPGAALPSGAECSSLVRKSPSPENRPGNERFNDTVGQQVGPTVFPQGDKPQAAALASRIDGDFTGSTEDILRWAACKWGINQDIVLAEAAVESWWNQTQLGDWSADATLCPPGHALGVDGKPGQCPQSFGILQVKYRYFETAWPGFGNSTAMNVDTMYAVWRSCYDGDEVWLNTQPHGKQYAAGDVWGCVGRWFAGSWYTAPAEHYIGLVKQYMNERIWETPAFGHQSQPVAAAG